MNSRKVSIAYLQVPTSIPGFGVMQQTELSGRTTPGIEMELTDLGLLLKKGNLYALVPTNNIKIMALQDEVHSEAKPK